MPKIFVPILVIAIAFRSGIATAANHQMNHDMGGMKVELGIIDANLDLRFIDGMILHHQGAISMAKEAMQKSKRLEIKNLATEIIKAQKREIVRLQEWRKAWYPRVGSTPMAWNSQMGHMMVMTETQRETMIPHHEGALSMAKEAEAKTKRSEVKKLTKDILQTQQVEISQMRAWRKAWYGK